MSTSTSKSQHIKAILKKSVPLILMQGTDITSNFIRTYLIAQTIKDGGLTASTIIYSITTFLLYPIPLLTAQDAVFIGEKFGKAKLLLAGQSLNRVSDIEDKSLITIFPPESENIDIIYAQIGSFVRQGWLLAFCAGVPSTIILMSLNKQLIEFFGQPQEIADLAQSYILPFALSVPMQLMLKNSERFMSAVDQEKWIIPYRLIVLGLETALNFLLIPIYSFKGAAYVQIIKSAFALTGLSIFFGCKTEFVKFKIFSRGLGDLNYIKKILSQGWPMMITQFLIVGNSFVVSTFVGKYGPSRLAVEQVMVQYFGLLTIINSGISESANRIVAQYFGAEKYNETRHAGNLSLVTNVSIYLGIATIYNLFSIPLSSLFINNDEDLKNMVELIRYNFIIMTIANLMNVIHDNCRANLTGVSDTLLVSIIPLVVGIALVLPLSALSTYAFNLDLYGITTSIAIGSLIGTTVVCKYWLNHSQKIIDANNHEVSTSNDCLTNFFCNRTKRNSNVNDNNITEDQSLRASNYSSKSFFRNKSSWFNRNKNTLTEIKDETTATDDKSMLLNQIQH